LNKWYIEKFIVYLSSEKWCIKIYFIMEELFITEEDLDYFTNIPDMVCEESVPYKSKNSFEEESKDCITLDDFSKLLDEAINRLMPDP